MIRQLTFTLALALTALATFPAPGHAQSNDIKYRKSISLKVGQSAVIHGLRGNCGSMPSKSDIAKMEQKYGDVKVGRIVAGKAGSRRSGSCGGVTPAIEAIFVAEKPGSVQFKLFGDDVKIRVTQ